MSLELAIPKLNDLEARYEQMGQQMLAPDVTSDIAQYRQISKAWSDLEDVVAAYRAYKGALREIAESEVMLDDAEMRELAQEELERLRPKCDELQEKLRLLLLPKDP